MGDSGEEEGWAPLFSARSEPGRPIPTGDLVALRAGYLVSVLGRDAARELLRVLQRPSDERAVVAARLHERKGPMADVLIDLEEDDLARYRLRLALAQILS